MSPCLSSGNYSQRLINGKALQGSAPAHFGFVGQAGTIFAQTKVVSYSTAVAGAATGSLEKKVPTLLLLT